MKRRVPLVLSVWSIPVAYPGISFRGVGGLTNSVEGRGSGDLGGGSP
jgi:hypothetical protein